MTDIVEFLTARLASDEAAAEAATAGPVEERCASGADFGPALNRLLFHRSFNPARVLAEVAAKRAILALHSPEDLEYVNADGDDRTGTVCATCDSLVGDWPCDTLKLLAAPYAEHPDYKPVWGVA